MILIAINGAAGRMGRRLIALTTEDDQLKLAAAMEHSEHPQLGQDAGVLAGVERQGVDLTDKMTGQVDVLIDFTSPKACLAAVRACVEARTAMVIGTTGLTQSDHDVIDEAAQSIPILQAPNMSLAVNLMFALAGQVAQRLGDDYDIEITEAHHRFKKDAPSGTAMAIVSAVCQATNRDLEKDVIYGRQGQDVPRERRQVAVHAMRMGDVVGEHSARFAALGERLEITHIATSRDIFVRGALAASKWVVGQSPGRYRMQDVLGL